MSLIIKCEKCGKTGEDFKKFRHIKGHVLTDASHYNTDCNNRMEVCKECYKKIFKKEDKNSGN